MPTTRSRGLLTNEAPEKTKVPRPRKKKRDKAHGAPKPSDTLLPSNVAQSPLFKLPPELRTIIYRYALLTDQDIDITESSGILEPALLSVCKILRLESYKVFYFENEFACMVEHYSPAND
jgi:hypothetical protein